MEILKKPIGLETLRDIDPNLETLLKNLIQRELASSHIEFYSGQVVDNNDPEQLGRCRIRVFGMFGDEVPDKALPWAIPDDKFVGSMVGSMIIPPNNALVRVFFDHGDIYSPVYTSKIPEAKFKSRHINKDYPDTMLFFETDNGDYMTINKKKSEITFHASGGTLIRIDNKGNLSVDTTECDPLYGGAFSLNVNGDVNMKTVGDVNIDAVGPPLIPVVKNPFEVPDPLNPEETRTNQPSRVNANSTGEINMITMGTPEAVPRVELPPDPTDPIAIALKKLEKFKKDGKINLITSFGDIEINTITGLVNINGMIGVNITSEIEVNVEAPSVKLGTKGTNAVNSIINSKAFFAHFDAHIHPGLGTPPAPPLASTLPSLKSQTVTTSL